MEVLTGRTCVVTGAASGIGRALALALGRAGGQVVLADVEKDALDETLAQMEAQGVAALGVPTDVRSIDQMEELAGHAQARFGSVDIVCLNAGVSPSGPMLETSAATWQWVIDVNLMGVVNGLQAFVPGLVRRGEGHVVITGSLAGLIPTPSLGPYSAVKHALTGLAGVLRAELLDSGVNVTLVCPSVVRTRIAESERNRPPEFPGASHADPVLARRYREAVEASSTSPDAVAEAVVAAIMENRFLVLPSPESLTALDQHIAQLQASIRP
jgi:NAD(P)-dependent dehydrogenase (short-subunit alcohol dehydrogenase family)